MKATKKDSLTLSDDPEIILPLLSFFFFFFYRQTHKKHILEKGTLRLTQKHTGSIQEAQKEEEIQNQPSTST